MPFVVQQNLRSQLRPAKKYARCDGERAPNITTPVFGDGMAHTCYSRAQALPTYC